MNRSGLTLFSLALVPLLTVGCADATPPDPQLAAQEQGVTYVAGNPDCASLELGDFEFKIDGGPFQGVFALDSLNTVTVTSPDGIHFDWSTSLPIDAVIAKGGPNANVYVYEDEASGEVGLSPPINPNTGIPYEISHLSFCFDYEVQVRKSAATSFVRTHDWSIQKTAEHTGLTLSAGQVFPEGYRVTVERVGHADSDFQVEGLVEVYNPAPFDATLLGVEDLFEGASIPLACGVSFPYTLASGTSLSCSYQVPVADASPRTNEAVVTTSGIVGGGSVTVPVSFDEALIEHRDECVTVNDDRTGELGTVCVDGAPGVFAYTLGIVYSGCGEYVFDNTATFAGLDTGTTASATASLAVSVPCLGGCTLTPGYWKTHSSFGPAPYDDTWALLPGAEETPFFLSDLTWYEAIWTSPKGNAYFVLVHAYVAATLNRLAGADVSAVTEFLQEAESLLGTYTPAQVASLRGSSPVRARFVALAAVLDAYNNGLIGPGHCDE